MPNITLYKILKRIPDTTDAEAEEVANDVVSVKEVATKDDIKDMVKEIDLSKVKGELIETIRTQETRLIKQMYASAGIIIAAVSIIVGIFNG